jgi:hypothetical protein
MIIEPYRIEQVGEKEYSILNQKKDSIIRSARNQINSFWRPKVDKINMHFSYDKSLCWIGIFVEKDGSSELVNNSTDFNEEERIFAYELRAELKQRLDLLRIENGNWE